MLLLLLSSSVVASCFFFFFFYRVQTLLLLLRVGVKILRQRGKGSGIWFYRKEEREDGLIPSLLLPYLLSCYFFLNLSCIRVFLMGRWVLASGCGVVSQHTHHLHVPTYLPTHSTLVTGCWLAHTRTHASWSLSLILQQTMLTHKWLTDLIE
ncbi:hypothetical protein F5Y13DRAFT_158157 [Hypoxylon sp. FL1857]|nr:hypothetical protein F5Y13DRAFT_158157 [Hypoxylon sp. FL1857]